MSGSELDFRENVMDEQAALLKEILADPGAVLPRLVYADWLDDAGDPLADLIRLQCAMHQRSSEDHEYQLLADEAERLLREHREEWITPLMKLGFEDPTFTRGFVENVRIRQGDLLRRKKAILGAVPVATGLRIKSANQNLPNVSRVSGIDRLRRLSFRFSSADVSTFARFFEAASLFDLRRLEFTGTSMTPRILSRSADFSNLRELELAGCGLKTADITAMDLRRDFPGLRELVLRSNALVYFSTEWFASVGLRQLRLLDLRGNRITRWRTNFTHLSAPHLRVLRLGHCGLTGRVLEDICRSEGLAHLEKLDIRGVELQKDEVHSLVTASFAGSLKRLQVCEADFVERSPRRLRSAYGDRLQIV